MDSPSLQPQAPEVRDTIADTRSKLASLRQRIFDMLGITALTRWILRWLRGTGAEPKEATPAMPTQTPTPEPAPIIVEQPAPVKQAVTAPVAIKRRATSILRKKEPTLAASFPQNQNLVGKPAMTFAIDGTEHTIAFRSNTIIIDRGNIFAVSALGTSIGDVELGITDARFADGAFSFTAGAWGEKDTATLNDEELRSMLTDLFKGKSVRRDTDDGRTIEIAAKKY